MKEYKEPKLWEEVRQSHPENFWGEVNRRAGKEWLHVSPTWKLTLERHKELAERMKALPDGPLCIRCERNLECLEDCMDRVQQTSVEDPEFSRMRSYLDTQSQIAGMLALLIRKELGELK